MVIEPLVAWRLLSSVRAIAALLIWIFLALSPSSNNLLEQLRDPVSQYFFTLLFFFFN